MDIIQKNSYGADFTPRIYADLSITKQRGSIPLFAEAGIKIFCGYVSAATHLSFYDYQRGEF